MVLKGLIEIVRTNPRILLSFYRGRWYMKSMYYEERARNDPARIERAARCDKLWAATGGIVETPDGLKICMPKDQPDFLPFLEGGNTEPKTTEAFDSMITGDSVVVDVGANAGWYTLRAALKARKVYAFEPDPGNFELLQRSVEMNGLANVNLERLGVGEIEGEMDLFLWIDSGRHSTIRKTGRRIKVGCTTLDSFFPSETIDILKVDVEGAEAKVLQGAKEAVGAGRVKNIVMELNPEFPQAELEMLRRRFNSYLIEGERNLVLKQLVP